MLHFFITLIALISHNYFGKLEKITINLLKKFRYIVNMTNSVQLHELSLYKKAEEILKNQADIY